jgi:hypothetical protein
LANILVLVVVYRLIGAYIHALFTARTLIRVEQNQTIVTAHKRAVRTYVNARRLATMSAKPRDIVDANLGNSPLDIFLKFKPKLPGFRLRRSVRTPIIVHVLVLAGELTVKTTVTFRDIYHKYL